MYALPQPASTAVIRSRSHTGQRAQQLDVVLHLAALVARGVRDPEERVVVGQAVGVAGGRGYSEAAHADDGRPRETSHFPFFVRRACRSPSGREQVRRCFASASSASRRTGQSSRATVSVCAPSTTFSASPRRSVTGVTLMPSATSFRQPAASARSRSSSMPASLPGGRRSAPAAGGAGMSRPVAARRKPQVRASARHARRRRVLPPTRGRTCRGTAGRRRPAPWRRRTRVARPPVRPERRGRAKAAAAVACARDWPRPRPARRSDRGAAQHPRTAGRARAGEASRAASEVRPRASPTRRLAAPAQRAARAACSSAVRARRAATCRRPSRRDVAGRRSGRAASSARSPAAAARGSAAAPRAPPRARSRRCATRRARARRAPPRRPGRCRSERKYERRRARRSRAGPTYSTWSCTSRKR